MRRSRSIWSGGRAKNRPPFWIFWRRSDAFSDWPSTSPPRAPERITRNETSTPWKRPTVASPRTRFNTRAVGGITLGRSGEAIDPESDLSTVREAAYQVLRELGMTVIFGNPGSTELPFLRDMPADFKYVLGLHERSAAGMAIGYALGTGRAAFANLHSIASSGNGLSSLVDAWHGHVPLVVTTGQQDRRQRFAEAFLSSQAVDTVKPYVKWAHEAIRAEDVPAAIARGFYLAMQP